MNLIKYVPITFVIVVMTASITALLLDNGHRPSEKTLFHAGDKVLVTKGFYEGCRGSVEEMIGINFRLYGLRCGNAYLNAPAFPPDFLSKEQQ